MTGLTPSAPALLPAAMLLVGLLSACGSVRESTDVAAGDTSGGAAGASTGGISGGSPAITDGGVGAGGSRAGAGGGAAAGPPSADIDCRREGDGRTTLVFRNGCSEAVSFRGSDIEGGSLAPGGFSCVDVGSSDEAIDSKRYWGFVGADPGPERHSLAEFTFNTSFYDFDWYDISFVDAFNLPVQLAPFGREDCDVLSCAGDLLAACPEEGRFLDDGGRLASCVSPNRDDPNSPVALYFEQCHDAYAWSGDDQEGDDPSPMRACAGEDWDIVFCPEQ